MKLQWLRQTPSQHSARSRAPLLLKAAIKAIAAAKVAAAVVVVVVVVVVVAIKAVAVAVKAVAVAAAHAVKNALLQLMPKATSFPKRLSSSTDAPRSLRAVVASVSQHLW